MYVLDLHAAPGGQGHDAISDYDSSKPSLWESTQPEQNGVLWKVAAHYADSPGWPGTTCSTSPIGICLEARPCAPTSSAPTASGGTVSICCFLKAIGSPTTSRASPHHGTATWPLSHKYWSNNDVATLDFALALRDAHQVPLYLGEAENSNVVRDAVRLLEDLGIGWAWWPLKRWRAFPRPCPSKRPQDISTGPLGRQRLCAGSGVRPSRADGFDGQTEGRALPCAARRGGCADASATHRRHPAFPGTSTLPGTVFAPDYDLGRAGMAYVDEVDATYHVSNGSFTAWNNGWTGRNDGVDIESCHGDFPHNGRAVDGPKRANG